MACHDPISDMLAKIRNAILAKHEKVDIKQSKEKLEIIKILKSEGLIKNFKKVVEDNCTYCRVFLKYEKTGASVISGVKRVSTPGRRIYKGYRDLTRLYNGMGLYLISTPKGIITDKKALENKVGGEILCSIW
jgi:small subunit ribosomal protein S8